jgi:hypothetical protein
LLDARGIEATVDNVPVPTHPEMIKRFRERLRQRIEEQRQEERALEARRRTPASA